MVLLNAKNWDDYELIDSGNYKKLEKFGDQITIRPEPQAIWDSSLPFKKWEELATLEFVQKTANSGLWNKLKPKAKEEWRLTYKKLNLTAKLKLTGFKHIGVFPEQSINWDYIDANITKIKTTEAKVLNLFAYTGMSSLAAQADNIKVTHVDSVKQVVTWANDNMSLSNKRNIRWIVEDARKFVAKEKRRGNYYNGIILDPPAFGHGAKGESWKLENDLKNLLLDIADIIDPKEHFFLLNTYSLGFSCLILENLLTTIFKRHEGEKEVGELFLSDNYKKKLPLGVFARFSNII